MDPNPITFVLDNLFGVVIETEEKGFDIRLNLYYLYY